MPMLEFQSISKSFSGISVLRQVSFILPRGHLLGLVGENGAGKSTLMNILGGNLAPDRGQILLEGKPFAPKTPLDAAQRGIAFIHQELNLFPNLTIGENIFLTRFPTLPGLPLIDRRELRSRTIEALENVSLSAPPETLVERLSPGERQLVEIAKALAFEARLIILDEPTTSLSARETEALFTLVRKLRSRGITMIYISHNLGDVLHLCDDVVILRDGQVAGSGTCLEFEANRMIALMVGRNLNQLYPSRTGQPDSACMMEVENVGQPGLVHNISFRLHRGEILGISGLMGAGRSELARILFGLDPCQQGKIQIGGQTLTRCTPRKRIHHGLAFLTENRRDEGLCMEAAIADNIALVSLSDHAPRPFRLLDFSSLAGAIQSIRRAVKLTPSALDEQPVKTLSGGNQQKVVLAKWLLAKPRVLILDEPTRGIDVGAKYEIYQLVNDLADQGTGILVISSEIEELTGICDRILVMSHGEFRDELRRVEFDRERIMRASLRERNSA